MTDTISTPHPPPSGPPARPPIDPLLAERLERLSATRSGRQAGPPGTPSGGARRRSHHPARGARVAALATSVGITGGLAAQFALADGWFGVGADDQALAATDSVVVVVGGADVATAAASPPSTSTESLAGAAATATDAAVGSSAAATTTVPTTSVPATSVAGAATGYVDGTYLGPSVDTRWGPVQVQVAISGGAIVDVQVVDFPTDDRRSVSINQRAVPILVSATLSSQVADVDTVSGATYTSHGYEASLQAALDAAAMAA